MFIDLNQLNSDSTLRTHLEQYPPNEYNSPNDLTNEYEELPLFDMYLTDELKILIFSYLSVSSIGSVSQVSTEWKRLANQQTLWSKIYDRFWGTDCNCSNFHRNNGEIDWKETVKEKYLLEHYYVTPSCARNDSYLDKQYHLLKEKALAKMPHPETLVNIPYRTTLEERINTIFDSNPDTNTLYLVDLTTLITKYKDWINILPNVEPFYAMKCNPDDKIVSTLVACGSGLDCASMQEMKVALANGLDGNKIIFANPCKMPAHVKFAKDHGIEMMTFDNKAELDKIHRIFPTAKMVLRILGDDSHSTMRFGSKFGANVHTEARGLLEYAYSLDLQVIGVSFHVGSGCQSAEAYTNSLKLARYVFDLAEELGRPMSFLDIGGGTPGVDTEDLKFYEIAKTISQNLKEMFPSNVRVIAEPGRYFASECVVLVTSIIAKRERFIEHHDNLEDLSYKQTDYYISDGVYGSFNNLFFDHAHAFPIPLQRMKTPLIDHSANSDSILDVLSAVDPVYGIKHPIFETLPYATAPPSESTCSCATKNKCTVFGPTCDSIDLICKDVELPDLEIGDIIYFFNMGAYTSAAASSFNGFSPPETVYMIS